VNRIDRLTSLLITIQSKKSVGIDFLADKYEVSKRTIYRDVNALIEAGVPIYQDDKRYRIMEGYYLPPMMITKEEATALLISEKLIKKYLDKSLDKELESLSTKIKAVLRYSDKEHLDAIDERIRVYTSTGKELGYRPTDSLFELQRAIAEQRLLEMSYINAAGEGSKRVIEPVGITQYGLGWHLIGWCRLRKEYRDFRIDRIQAYNILKEHFELRDKDPLTTYLVQLSEKNIRTE